MKKYTILITIIILASSTIYLSFDRTGAEKMKNKKGTAKMANNPQNKNQKEFVTASGLKYEIIKMGDGEKPEATDRVEVHYHGTLLDGTIFDSSVDRGTPFEFILGGRVIKGWNEGIALLNTGAKAKFIIPPHLAYGPNGAGGVIPPNATLIFEVELLEIKDDGLTK